MVESELQGDTSSPHKDTAQARRKIADIAIQMARGGDIEIPDKADASAPPPA
jgi:flagellar motor switch protein FliG